MMPSRVLIAFASWEPRCELGMMKTLAEQEFRQVIFFYSEEYKTRTSPARTLIADHAKKNNILYSEIAIVLASPSSWWQLVQTSVGESIKGFEEVVLDYSTCPRNILWCVLSVFKKENSEFRALYYPPAQNGYGEWLSADPEQPVLMYGHSGIADPLKPTGLIVSSGFDVQRTAQLYNVFEPERMIVLLQTGDQFQNREKNLSVHLEWLNGRKDDRLTAREIDAYSSDHGIPVLQGCIDDVSKTCNVVLASLGPKPGSIAMYKIWAANTTCALAYVPSKQYNDLYSHGISPKIEEMISFK